MLGDDIDPRETLGKPQRYSPNRATQREFLVLEIEAAQINERRHDLMLKAHDEELRDAQAKRVASGFNPSGPRERRLKQERRRLELAAEGARLETKRLEHQLEDFDIDTAFDEEMRLGEANQQSAVRVPTVAEVARTPNPYLPGGERNTLRDTAAPAADDHSLGAIV